MNGMLDHHRKFEPESGSLLVQLLIGITLLGIISFLTANLLLSGKKLVSAAVNRSTEMTSLILASHTLSHIGRYATTCTISGPTSQNSLECTAQLPHSASASTFIFSVQNGELVVLKNGSLFSQFPGVTSLVLCNFSTGTYACTNSGEARASIQALWLPPASRMRFFRYILVETGETPFRRSLSGGFYLRNPATEISSGARYW